MKHRKLGRNLSVLVVGLWVEERVRMYEGKGCDERYRISTGVVE